MKKFNTLPPPKRDAYSAYKGIPGHRTPDGNMQSFMDGSGRWIKFEDMIFIHSWNNSTRDAYFYQEDLGNWTPPDAAYATP